VSYISVGTAIVERQVPTCQKASLRRSEAAARRCKLFDSAEATRQRSYRTQLSLVFGRRRTRIPAPSRIKDRQRITQYRRKLSPGLSSVRHGPWNVISSARILSRFLILRAESRKLYCSFCDDDAQTTQPSFRSRVELYSQQGIEQWRTRSC